MKKIFSEEQIMVIEGIHNSVQDTLGEIQINTKAPETIYHYTSVQNLYSILNEGEFWITHIKYMNDSSETQYFWEVVEEVLSTIPEKISVMKDNAIYKNIVAVINSKKEIIKADEEFTNQYVLSLSSQSDALSMWNYYGKNDGYCIGLSSNSFLKNLGLLKTTRKIDSYLAAHVLYDREKQIEILDQDCMSAIHWFVKNLRKEKWNKIEEITILESCISSLVSYWFNYLPFFKHESFKEESEFRIVIQHRNNNKAIKYRAYQGVIAPYIEYDFKVKDGRLPLQSIKAGPLIQHNLAIEGLRSWLLTKKIETTLENIELSKSTIPLRF